MKAEIIHIIPTDELYRETIFLAKNCSFQGSGQYLSELMKENCFSGFERVYCATVDNCVAGFCIIANETCCEYDAAPWLDFLFVTEKYRKLGIARQMISEVKKYAKSIGFEELYLCTASHEKYYEENGFITIATVPINELTTGKVMKSELL